MFRIAKNLLIQALMFASLAVSIQGRNFTDDRGAVFSWPDDGANPTIAVNANGAIALFHMGMTKEQILGVWDKWVIRGSNIDVDSDNLDSVFAADPNQAELDLLKSVTDLSTGCSGSSEGCPRDDFDAALLNELDPDFIVYMHHGPYPEVTNQLVDRQSTLIFIDDRFEDGEGCRTTDNQFDTTDTKCYARSVMDYIARTQELANFLGVATSEEIAQDQQAMCEAANEFSLMAEELHNRGVRCAGATARMNGGGNINLVNLNQIAWLRTFEELGLPLIHPQLNSPTDFTRTYSAEQWFPGCDRFGRDDYNCDGVEPVLPVDCWLFDSRSYPVILEAKDEILAVLSVEAIKEEQFSSLLMNDGAISYKTVAAVLREVTEDLRDVQRIHDETDCTVVDVTSREHTSLAFGSLGGGEYACFNRETLNQEMLTCPQGFTPGVSSAGSSDDADADISASGEGLQSTSSSRSARVLHTILASLVFGSLALFA